MKYLFGSIEPGRKACRLTSLQGVDDDFELLRGISRINGFPEDAYFKMDKNFPDDLRLEDFVFNSNGLLVVSEKVKDILTKDDLVNNELLDVVIVNHKGRKEKARYFILHQVNLQACINESKSIGRANSIDTKLYSIITKLVLDDSKVNQNVELFRMARYPFLPMFREDLTEKIMREGCTGIQFGEPMDWTGM